MAATTGTDGVLITTDCAASTSKCDPLEATGLATVIGEAGRLTLVPEANTFVLGDGGKGSSVDAVAVVIEGVLGRLPISIEREGGPNRSNGWPLDQRCNNSRASLVLSEAGFSIGRAGGRSTVLSNVAQMVQLTRWLSDETSAATSAWHFEHHILAFRN
jgi:hypothetical protein